MNEPAQPSPPPTGSPGTASAAGGSDASTSSESSSLAERRLEWRVAVIGAVSALVGSALGVGGSLVVAQQSLDAERQTVSNAQRRADEEAVTEERRAAYVDLLAAVEQVEAGLGSLTLRPRSPDTVAASLAETRRIVDLQYLLNEPQARILLYGSPEGVRAAAILEGEINLLLVTAVRVSVGEDGTTPEDLDVQRDVATDAQDAFSRIARSELGADSLDD